MFEVLRESIESLGSFVAVLDPAALDGVQAKEMVEDFAQLERLASAGRTLVSGRVAETGARANDGPYRDAGAWMADVAGTTIGRAKATIEAATRLAALPSTAAAFRAGSLSQVQVEAISVAATANPRAERALLVSAATDGVRGLKDACARVEAAASTDQAERYESARVRRSLRFRRISDVEGSLEMRGPLDLTARVMAALEPIEGNLFEEARASECREEPAALAFDAMVRMADDSATVAFESGGSRAPATIVGVGPVPVDVLQRLVHDSFLKALITDGTDGLSVSHLGRTIPVRLRTALEELQPECVIAGCHTDRHLEIDHNVPVEEQGLTALWNLNRVCRHHHRVKTVKKLRIVGEGTNKRLVPASDEPP